MFDWSGKGKTVRVAVLARETLTEAEGFATTYGFSPLGFAAIPDYGDFTGEPWFGDAPGAAAMLADGDTVERDKSPIRIVHREVPKPEPRGRDGRCGVGGCRQQVCISARINARIAGSIAARINTCIAARFAAGRGHRCLKGRNG